MKSFLSIIVASLYLALSIGLTMHVHHCDEPISSMDEMAWSPVVPIVEDCNIEDKHSCCEKTEETSCCSEPDTPEDCCYDSHVYIQIVEEQIVTKSLILISLPELSVLEKHDFSFDYIENRSEIDVFMHPPPLEEQKYILYCSFTLYG